LIAGGLSLAERTQTTYSYERLRSVAAGILDTAANTFLLLVAVRWFESGPAGKALVASGGSVGLLLSPLVVSYVENSGLSPAKAASRLAASGALCFLLMLCFPILPVYILGSLGSMAASSAAIPLLTQIYQENYPPAKSDRGRRPPFRGLTRQRLSTPAAGESRRQY